MVKVLILGAEGMVGREVFAYLSQFPEIEMWGTTRNKKHVTNKLLFFDVQTYRSSLKNIYQKTSGINYIINCIGILTTTSPLIDLISVNALFPHLLEKFADENGTKLIHVSSDAVFSPLCGTVTEQSPSTPVDHYGMSKKLGEIAGKNSLTIRSSFIGLDPINRRGLLEAVRKSKNSFPGYTNQVWTGCTTLQLAHFCKYIITTSAFDKIRRQTSVIHFTPLGPVSKYTLVKNFSILARLKITINKTHGEKRKRILTSNYFDLLAMNQYTSNIRESIKQLLIFEKRI